MKVASLGTCAAPKSTPEPLSGNNRGTYEVDEPSHLFEGKVMLIEDGSETRTFSAGESFHNAAGFPDLENGRENLQDFRYQSPMTSFDSAAGASKFRIIAAGGKQAGNDSPV